MTGAWATDPALQLTVRAALSLLFFWAAGHKLRDLSAFRAALSAYDLMPARAGRPFTALLIAGELGVAFGLLLPGLAARAALAAAGLLAVYASAIGINLLRGRRDIDCGCAGANRGQALSAGLLTRNVVLLSAALSSVLPAAPRVLTWLDGVTVGAGVVSLVLLYAAADGLLMHASRSRILTLAGDRVGAGLVEPERHRVKHA